MARENLTQENSYLVTWTVEPGEVGVRLDLFLKEKYKRLSREYLQKAIKNGRVTVNHKQSKPSQILRLRDKVYVLSTRGQEPEVDFNYQVLYEDDAILVIDKPGNLPVHPSGRYFFNTLLTQLRVVNSNEVDTSKDFFIVHRIDRETSGVLVLGKTSAAAASLVSQFQNRQTDKEYIAIVKGVMEKDEMDIDVALSRDPRSEIRVKMHPVELGGDGKPLYIPESEVLPAKTLVRVVERLKNYTIVQCKPHTGRQHQIRVHLDHIGHPIIGDKLYGNTSELFLKNIINTVAVEVEPGLSLFRHALHAYRLSFFHPVTREKLEFRCDLPPALQEFLNAVKSQS